MYHFKTIRTYVASLLNFLSNLEIENEDSNGNIITKKIPVQYASKEKSQAMQMQSDDQLLSGNSNIIPRGTLVLVSMMKDDSRQQNRNNKINIFKDNKTIQYSFNSVAYNFIFEFRILCRGMNEVFMIIEEIAPKFNPNCSLDVFDVENLPEATRIPLKMLDISFEEVDPDSDVSSNLFYVICSFQLEGQLYQPIFSLNRIVEYKQSLKIGDFDYKIVNFDINSGYVEVINNQITILGFDKNELSLGNNELKVNYKTSLDDDVKFEWGCLTSNAEIISQNRNNVKIHIQDGEQAEIICILKSSSDTKSIRRVFKIN